MLISELNHLEVVSEAANVAGGYGYGYPTYFEYDKVKIEFDTTNKFKTDVTTNFHIDGNSAASGAKAEATNPYKYYGYATESYTKADTISYAEYGGDSFSGSTSVAVIDKMH